MCLSRFHSAVPLAAASSESLGGGGWRARFPVWPEWSDADVSKEKWDQCKGSEDGKTSKNQNTVNMMNWLVDTSPSNLKPY